MNNPAILPLHTKPVAANSARMGEAGKRIGDLLTEAGRLAGDDAQRIHEFQKDAGLPFGEAGIAMGLITELDVKRALDLQFGHPTQPSGSTLSRELAAVWQPDSEPVEQLRALRSQLMLRWFENDARHTALAVVSPGSGEGRSYISANLAVLFAQLGKRTLLVDADLRRPRQHRIFGLPGRIGLSGILAGRAGLDAVAPIESMSELSVLPAGALPPNPQELLARAGFAKLLGTLRTEYEVILVDTPAASTCADAGTVAARAGAALMVACRDRSSVPRVAALTDDMRQFGVTMVGAVLNGARKT